MDSQKMNKGKGDIVSVQREMELNPFLFPGGEATPAKVR
jgi:hypothetical protein